MDRHGGRKPTSVSGGSDKSIDAHIRKIHKRLRKYGGDYEMTSEKRVKMAARHLYKKWMPASEEKDSRHDGMAVRMWYHDHQQVIDYIWKNGMEQKFNLKMFVNDRMNGVTCAGCMRTFRMRSMAALVKVDGRGEITEFNLREDRDLVKYLEKMKEGVIR